MASERGRGQPESRNTFGGRSAFRTEVVNRTAWEGLSRIHSSGLRRSSCRAGSGRSAGEQLSRHASLKNKRKIPYTETMCTGSFYFWQRRDVYKRQVQPVQNIVRDGQLLFPLLIACVCHTDDHVQMCIRDRGTGCGTIKIQEGTDHEHSDLRHKQVL